LVPVSCPEGSGPTFPLPLIEAKVRDVSFFVAMSSPLSCPHSFLTFNLFVQFLTCFPGVQCLNPGFIIKWDVHNLAFGFLISLMNWSRANLLTYSVVVLALPL